METKQIPLNDLHVKLGGKMVPFAGFNMPVRYSSDIEEHMTVRKGVGVFDVSHMGEFLVKGPHALDLIQLVTSNDASKLIDGRFPDYEAVIPIGADKMFSVSRDELRASLQRAAILSNEKYRGVKLELAPNKLNIVAHNPEQEEAVEELEVQTVVDGLSVGFNVNYLLDALGALRGNEVTLALRDSNSSCLIRDADNERSRHVIMPLRL